MMKSRRGVRGHGGYEINVAVAIQYRLRGCHAARDLLLPRFLYVQNEFRAGRLGVVHSIRHLGSPVCLRIALKPTGWHGRKPNHRLP
jgi:hypothetical protein